ncbi:MAG: GPW/gp25 family protein, partial [Burkholderiales bacterium]|nr:GPW/gp25 family protein [Burkholderiales bacterium]
MSLRVLAFPFGLAADGRVATADAEQVIRQRIEQLLFTDPGERVMLPEFGCGLNQLVFQGNNPLLAAAAEFRIAKALQN